MAGNDRTPNDSSAALVRAAETVEAGLRRDAESASGAVKHVLLRYANVLRAALPKERDTK